MKKDKILFINSIAMLSILTACNTDERILEYPKLERDKILLSTGVGELNKTRATSDDTNMQDTQFTTGEKVDIWIFESNNAGTGVNASATTTYGTNGKTTYTASGNGGFSETQSNYWPSSGEKVFIYGFYPTNVVSDPTATSVAFSIEADQSGTTDWTNYRKSDLMVGVPAANPVARTEEAVPITFTHKLSKVNVILVAGVGLEANDLVGATIKLHNVNTSVNLNPSSGAIANEGTPGTVTVWKVASSTDLRGSAIVVPTNSISSNDFISVTLSEAKGGGTLTYSAPSAGISILSTYEYNYTVTVNLTGLSVSTTINNWNTKNPSTNYDGDSNATATMD